MINLQFRLRRSLAESGMAGFGGRAQKAGINSGPSSTENTTNPVAPILINLVHEHRGKAGRLLFLLPRSLTFWGVLL
jgi:hypothetical protein